MPNPTSRDEASSSSVHEIDGFLDAVAGSALWSSISVAIEDGAESLLLDLSAVDRLDVPGLASVVASSLAAARADASVSIRMPVARGPRQLLEQANLPAGRITVAASR